VILYLDTSSLVKLYLEEDHSDSVREFVAAAEAVATSRVAYAEALSAFARRHQEGDLSDESFELVCEVFDAQWPHLVLLPVKERSAGGLAIRQLLRGFDAIHLAAALDLVEYQVAADGILFSSFDARLLRAARAEGFSAVFPPLPAEL
jgi:predicted nucleic acid-binding protein